MTAARALPVAPPADAVRAAAEADAATDTPPSVDAEAATPVPTVAEILAREAAGDPATAPAADAARGAAEGTADFSAVTAHTSSPVRPVALVAPSTPVQIGAHAPQAPGLGGAFLALVLVLGLILGLAWLLKRLPGSGFRQADGLRVVASIPLGAKERAAVVQVGGEQLLLGIGAGGVRTLHVLPQPLPEPAPVQMPTLKTLPDFKQLLAQRLRKDT